MTKLKRGIKLKLWTMSEVRPASWCLAILGTVAGLVWPGAMMAAGRGRDIVIVFVIEMAVAFLAFLAPTVLTRHNDDEILVANQLVPIAVLSLLGAWLGMVLVMLLYGDPRA